MEKRMFGDGGQFGGRDSLMARKETTTAPAETTKPKAETATEQRLVTVSPGRPAYPVRALAAFGTTAGDWRALVDAIFPAAKTTEAVELALAYCRARKLDIFKRPIHIVPVWDSKLGREVETVWPGIGELRTTAARTGAWAGCDEAVFGPDKTQTFEGVTGKGTYAKEQKKTVTFPEWCSLTVYKLVQGKRVPFPGPKVYWLETYATMGATDVPNEMWATRSRGQLEKTAEAAALRRAFPEEIGSDLIAEEVGRRPIASAVATDLPAEVVATSKLDAFAAARTETAKTADFIEQVLDEDLAQKHLDRDRSSTLTAAQVDSIRRAAEAVGVPVSEIEEAWASPLPQITVAEDEDAETEILDWIEAKARKGEEG
jgi:phage recombination protein Bet